MAVTVEASERGRIIASRKFPLGGYGAAAAPITVSTFDLAQSAVAAGERFLPQSSREDTAIGSYFAARSAPGSRAPTVIVFDDQAVGESSDYIGPLLRRFGAAVFVLPVTVSDSGVYAASVFDTTAFAALLDWLDQRPDVDKRKVFTYGTSQSAQFALWAAARFNDRVAGVFAAGGATALLCLRGAGASPVSENGVPVPCHQRADVIDDGALLPLGSVTAPVVLGCAGRDDVLPNACPWLDAAVRIRGPRVGDVIIRAPDAVHEMTAPPGLPIALPEGETAQATEKARVQFWDAVSRVLREVAD